MSILGEGIFTFTIPDNTLTTLATIGFTITYGDTEYIHSHQLIISKKELMIVDFFTETNEPLVLNVTNKVYF